MPPGVWLVRHAATSAPKGVAIGSSDPHLSVAGRAQARALAEDLATRELAAIYSSDRVRAIHTAAAIAAVHGLPVQVDSRLREIDFGAWEGRNLAELWLEEPEAAVAWEADLAATPTSFAETVAQLQSRVGSFLEQMLSQAGGEIAVVGHRGSLAVLRSLLTGEALAESFRSELAVGARYWLDLRVHPSRQLLDSVEDRREVGR
jgi:broad specificity phosphatase PhoE